MGNTNSLTTAMLNAANAQPPMPKPAQPKHTGAIEIRMVGFHPKDGAESRWVHTITEEDFRRMSFFDFTQMVIRRISEGAAALRKLDGRVVIDSLEGVETSG